MYGLILFLHVLSATVWTGGHLVLAVTILPRALREKSTVFLQQFETGYERIGIPALIIQVITGVWLAYRLVPRIELWFSFSDPVSTTIFAKIVLLLMTVGFAIDARLRIIPRLTEKNLVSLAYHIVPVTVLSVLFVLLGVSFKFGFLF